MVTSSCKCLLLQTERWVSFQYQTDVSSEISTILSVRALLRWWRMGPRRGQTEQPKALIHPPYTHTHTHYTHSLRLLRSFHLSSLQWIGLYICGFMLWPCVRSVWEVCVWVYVSLEKLIRSCLLCSCHRKTLWKHSKQGCFLTRKPTIWQTVYT